MKQRENELPALVHSADAMTLMRSAHIGEKLTYMPMYKTKFEG